MFENLWNCLISYDLKYTYANIFKRYVKSPKQPIFKVIWQEGKNCNKIWQKDDGILVPL